MNDKIFIASAIVREEGDAAENAPALSCGGLILIDAFVSLCEPF
jgi:hypothetical protein